MSGLPPKHHDEPRCELVCAKVLDCTTCSADEIEFWNKAANLTLLECENSLRQLDASGKGSTAMATLGETVSALKGHAPGGEPRTDVAN